MDLKVSDTIIVQKRPDMWNSKLSWNYPLDTVSFPHILTIHKIFNLSMVCEDGYGWSLDSIQKAGYIIANNIYELW